MSITDGELTSVALCWTAERSDGAGIALTSHDCALTRYGVMFDPAPGLTPARVSQSSGLDPQDAELTGSLNGEGLTEADLALGRWDGARVQLTAVDWQEAELGSVALLEGSLGEVSQDGGRFSGELKGAAAALSRPVCPHTSPECRAELGDEACRVDLAGRTLRTRILASEGVQLTLAHSAGEQFVLGRLRYLSGANCGVVTSVIGVAGNLVRTRDMPRFAIEPGCSIELREGCDKRLQTCAARFANAANFRGEPHLPGNDLLTRYPGS